MDLHPGPEKRRVLPFKLAEVEHIQRALQDNQDWYADLVEHSHDLLCVHDLAGRLLAVNPAPARLLGYSVEEIMRIPMRELMAPESRDHLDAYLDEIERTGESHGLVTVMTRSGERRIWEYHNTLRTEGVPSPVVRGMAHDVTEQRETEQLLREVSERLLSRVRESEKTIQELKLFRTLVDQCNEAIKVLDPETLRFLDVNQKACLDLGYTREELLSLTVLDINPTITGSIAEKVKAELGKSGFIVMEALHRRKDGSTFPVEVSLRRVQMDREYRISIARDITERKRAEEELQASEHRYRAVHDCSPVGICWVETQTGRLLKVNPKYCEITGRTEQDLLERNFQSITHPDDLVENCSKLRQLAEGKLQHYGMEKRYIRPDGSVRWVEVGIVTMAPEGESPVWHMAIVQDITERKQAEAALRESERIEKLVLDHLPVGVVLTSGDEERTIYQNPKFLELFGYSIEQFPTVAEWWPLAYPDPVYREQLSRNWRRRMEAARTKGEIEPNEVTITCHDGTKKYVRVLGRVIGDRNFVAFVDLTERKQAEEALKKSEEKFSKAFRQSPMSITLTTIKDHRYIEVNETFERMTGWGRDEVIGRTPFDIELWVNPAERVGLAKRVQQEGRLVGVEVQFRRKDGAIRTGLVTAEQIEVNGEACAIAVFDDITDRRRAEEALRRSEENYRLFVSQSSEGIFREEMDAPVSIDLPEDELIHHILHDSYMAECNDALARMYGLKSGQEFAGKRLTEMLPPEDPRNIELTRDYIRSGFRVLERESHEFDIHGNPKVFLNSMIGTVENGMLVRTWGMQREITEQVKLEEARRRAEEAVRASESHFRLLVEQASDGIFVADAQGKYLDVNSAGAEMLGYSRGEILQLSISDIVAAEEIPSIAAEIARFADGSVTRTEWRFRRKDGSFFPGELVGRQLPDGRLQGIVRDISERRQAEEALRRSEQRFRVALSGSPIKIFNQDRDLRYTWVYNLQDGWTEEDYLGKTDEEVFEPAIAARMAALKRPVIETGRGKREEFTLTARGKTHYCDVTVEPLLDAAGQVVGVNCASVDITHLRQVTEELRLAKEKLSEEKLYLEETIDSELGFGEIIGSSSALKDVMKKVAQVAPSDATVLLLGETGTGKELVARALHRKSLREGNSFIKLNCAAIPSGLLESELFGHEKGSFTGAVARKLGRVELADRGTLFLDEIGEISPSLQPKLLRVLQDQEFERLGGTQTLKVNFRLLAATNRDLLQSVKAHEFRSDLYYRLNVFPIYMPPLRERREDIRPLVEHFVRKFAVQMKKSVTSVPSKSMEMLVRWEWPGNIRELENFIERSVILTPGSVLQAPLSELETTLDAGNGGSKDNLRDKERERILRALRDCHGQLGGPAGAAARLGLKRTTLQSKLDHLGIKPGTYRA